MRDWITLVLVAAAFTLMGVMGGVAMSNANTTDPDKCYSGKAHRCVAPADTPTPTAKVRPTLDRASRGNQRRVTTVPRPPGALSGISATGHSGRETYQTYARARVSAREWPCLRELVQRESSWNPEAVTGSHYGLFQQKGLPVGTPWRYQIVRGLAYIDHRYGGDVCVALSHSDRNGWY